MVEKHKSMEYENLSKLRTTGGKVETPQSRKM